jgi:hypothetical protein
MWMCFCFRCGCFVCTVCFLGASYLGGLSHFFSISPSPRFLFPRFFAAPVLLCHFRASLSFPFSLFLPFFSLPLPGFSRASLSLSVLLCCLCVSCLFRALGSLEHSSREKGGGLRCWAPWLNRVSSVSQNAMLCASFS